MQDRNTGYDTYDSAVVAAESIEDAKRTSPDHYRIWKEDGWHFLYSDGSSSPETCFSSWTNDPEEVTAEFIGIASVDVKKGVVVASFNAG